jgi:DNA-binding transcriptional ArsR family regulator
MSNHSSRGSWEPKSFQIDLSDVASPNAGIRKGRRITPISDKFIKGPVNVVWLSQARQLGVAALWVGLSLWFLRGLRRSDSFIVSNLTMREWDVLPDAKRRALRALEKAGLITIERRGRRSPRVTLVVEIPAVLRHEA